MHCFHQNYKLGEGWRVEWEGRNEGGREVSGRGVVAKHQQHHQHQQVKLGTQAATPSRPFVSTA